MRSIFGRDRERNCALQVFNLSNRYLDLKFWFGGRVLKSEWTISFEEKEKAAAVNFMQNIVPCPIDKQLLFLSPCIPTLKLPQLL